MIFIREDVWGIPVHILAPLFFHGSILMCCFHEGMVCTELDSYRSSQFPLHEITELHYTSNEKSRISEDEEEKCKISILEDQCQNDHYGELKKEILENWFCNAMFLQK